MLELQLKWLLHARCFRMRNGACTIQALHTDMFESDIPKFNINPMCAWNRPSNSAATQRMEV